MLPYKNEAADDYRMLAGIYNRKETRKVSPIGHKDWSKWRDVGQIGYTQKDKQRDERYTYPVVQATSGAIKTLAGLVSSPSCATGAGCAGAAYLLGTGVDDTWTGITNFGKDAQEHEDSIRIQAATAAGVPRKVAVYTDFALDMAAGAAVSKIGGAARDSQLATNSKIGLNELQEKYPNNSVTRESGNWLPTRERVNQNIQETRRGNQSSQFGTHAQRKRENKNQIVEKSTGRTIPKDLREKLAMEQVKANPQGITPPRMPPMSDTKNGWLAKDGWVKRTQNVNGIEIHYIENTKTGQKTDFKFKD